MTRAHPFRTLSRAFLGLFVAIALTANPYSGVHADAPVGQYSIGPDVVTDNRTGLQWQRSAPDTPTPALAAEYCAQLPLAGGGWRLPSFRELQSIVDVTRRDPAIDVIAFPNTASGAFSTTGGGGFSWYVNFYDGTASTGAGGNVRCVR